MNHSHGHTVSRRDALSLVGGAVVGAATLRAARADSHESSPGKSWPIYKSVKWGMIGTDDSVVEKFRLCKELGYDGMELTSPFAASADEVRSASEATGMPVHGLVPGFHWQTRLSSPDPKTRQKARELLLAAIRDCAAFGGDTVLLVPGKVSGPDETHDDVWQRSISEIRHVLPVAAKQGVRILIENVWNGFCETPEQFCDYLDEIGSPWVGAYFDLGNCQKFAPTADWINALGSRIVKLDVKDWGQESGFGKIGAGDVDWQAVREALRTLQFTGWSTAEVGGGGRERLAEIAQNMNDALGIES